MIERYTRPVMGNLWKIEYRFAKMLEVEIAVAEAQAELKIIPKKAALEIKKKGKFQVDRILEIEQVTKHDVIAFVSNVAENVGPMGKFIHFGMTSSDVLDTAFSLQVQEAYRVLEKSLNRLEKALKEIVFLHQTTLCAGRTHGMFAEPTTFGFKMAGFLSEFKRHRKRVKEAVHQMKIVKLSGAVGTYSGQPPEVEKKVAQKLGLTIEPIATQVIPRDRHAELICAIALLGAGLERAAVELRHLQRSEVSEVTEGFSKGQKGSSAMPHKKNPISAENITGLSRLLRSYALAALENVALWHERDISHSSVERVIFPDSFIVVDYATDRLASVFEGLEVHKERMKENLDASRGQVWSSQVLLVAVQAGFSREEAYKLVQNLSHSLSAGETLQEKVMEDPMLGPLLSKNAWIELFEGKRNIKHVQKIIERVL